MAHPAREAGGRMKQLTEPQAWREIADAVLDPRTKPRSLFRMVFLQLEAGRIRQPIGDAMYDTLFQHAVTATLHGQLYTEAPYQPWAERGEKAMTAYLLALEAEDEP